MLKIGWALRDMTPDRPAMLQGQMHRRIARSAMDPLTLTALAIEGGEPSDCAVIISADLAMISDSLQNQVRKRLAQRMPSVPSDRIFLNATHTHTSLVIEDGFYPPADGGVMTPEECEELVASRAADAAAEAWERRAPQSLAFAFGHAVVGHNRRAVYACGAAQMYGRTDREDFIWIEGYEDHSLDMMFTWDVTGRLSGVALDIPCPSQVDEGLEMFSADFWHDIRQELRHRLGDALHVLPLCGAAGDQSPHFLLYGREEAEMRRRRGLSERREIARRVGDAVERALVCTVPNAGDIPFAHTVRRIELTPRSVSRAERDWAAAERERYVARHGGDSWWPQCLQTVVDYHDGKARPQPFPVELHVLRIGDAAVATNPFELFVDYGLRIKARSPAAQTLIVQIAAGAGWYLPTARAVAGGGYGAMPAVSKVGPEGGDELVAETLRLIGELFPARR
jgi:hypothetical protein